jgi:hypothetical protein
MQPKTSYILWVIYDANELCELASAYMQATRMNADKLGTLAAGHNLLFYRLMRGADCRTQAAEKASDWFDKHWPKDVPWPHRVPKRDVNVSL